MAAVPPPAPSLPADPDDPAGTYDGPLVPGHELYRVLVDNLPQSAVMLYDLELRFLLAGGDALRRAGISVGSVRGRSLAEVVAPDSLAVLEPAYRAALRGEDVDFEYVAGHDGRTYRVRVRPVRSSEGIVAGLVVTDDVTEQRRADERWQQVFRDAPVGMWLAEPGPDGTLVEVNDALCELVGLSREALLGSRKADLVEPDDLERVEQAVAAARGDGPVLERRLVRPDGTVRWLSLTSRLLDTVDGQRSLAHVVDVTAAREAEHELREALAFQHAVLAVIPDPVHVAGTDLGEPVWESRTSPGQEVVPDDRHLIEQGLRAVAAAQDGEVVQVRHRTTGPDGTVRWLDRRKTPFTRTADGRVEQYVGVTRDVTREVDDEEALTAALVFRDAVLSGTPDIVEVLDLGQERTIWANRSLTDLLGYGPDDAPVGLRQVVHADDLEGFARSLQELAWLPDGEAVEGELRVRHAYGSWRTLARRSTPFRRDASGRVTQVLSVSRDVSEQRETHRELERVRAFQEAVITTTPDVVIVLDTETGRPTWASRDLSQLLGWSLEEISAWGPRPFDRVVDPQHNERLRVLEQQCAAAADGEVVQGAYRARHRDGGWRWLARRATPFSRHPDGTVSSALLVVRDVTDAMEVQRQLEHAALHDPLTGLPNRRLVADRLRHSLEACARGGAVVVLFLDLDGFKRVNDAHGHEAGDAVLVETASRLRQVVRPGDTVGRMGGDEFVVVLTPDADLQDAHRLGERLLEAVARPVLHAGLAHQVTVSVGLRVATERDDADTVLRDADSAMYRAKTAGKDRLAVFDPTLQAAAVERSVVERALRAALSAGEVEVQYQPIVRSSDGALVGREALLRVRADGLLLDTPQVVEVAEHTGLILELGRQVLTRACRDAAAWAPDVHLAVNLSAREIAQPALYERVLAALADSGLTAERLVIELTETVLLEAAGSTLADLRRLRTLGIGIAIDDFGTGYASLRYLAVLPISCVKVDRSFTAQLGLDPVSTTLVHATVRLADDLGIDCVVEGVETALQLQAVGTGDRLLLQGFLLGPPGPVPPAG